jgi:hypothetical protein
MNTTYFQLAPNVTNVSDKSFSSNGLMAPAQLVDWYWKRQEEISSLD